MRSFTLQPRVGHTSSCRSALLGKPNPGTVQNMPVIFLIANKIKSSGQFDYNKPL